MVKIFRRIIKDIFRVIPGKAVIYCGLDILHAYSIVLAMALTQNFFDHVIMVADGEAIGQMIKALLLFFFGMISMEVCNGLANFKFEFLSPKVLAHMHKELHGKAAKMEAVCYEDPAFLDCIEKAQQGIESGLMASWFVLTIFSFYLPYYIFMAVYLNNLSPFLLMILVFVFLPVILGKLVRFRIYKQVEEEIAPERRAMEYYDGAICERDFFKETRLWGAFDYFFDLFRGALELVNKNLLKAEIKYARMDFILRLLTVGGYIGILFVLVQELLKGKITAGGFAAVFSGVRMMFSLAEEVFGGVMRYISRNAAAIFNYYKFLDLPDSERCNLEEDPSPSKGIEFKDVFFQYPGASKDAIAGVSLFIPAGKIVAIVGENGSGKTTLVKLMLGLYKPKSGSICVNGLDTTVADERKIQGECSAVFQKFQKYRMSLRENVTISDYQKPGETDVLFERACENADLDVSMETFCEGPNTILSREFGGVDLSGGEWQRVATARGLYRDKNILFLDEPTSAIDPLEETRVYRKFAELSQGKTAVIVTHRIGAAQIADFIVVMKEGKIDEVGTHHELLMKGGTYALMYHEQAKWYKAI